MHRPRPLPASPPPDPPHYLVYRYNAEAPLKVYADSAAGQAIRRGLEASIWPSCSIDRGRDFFLDFSRIDAIVRVD